MTGTVLQDPSAELVALVRRSGDEPTSGDRRAAALVRRRFAMALPPPFASAADPTTVAVRPAVATDSAAIAAVKWRTFGTSSRGVLPDAFLDRRDVVPPPSFWARRAADVPMDRRCLLVLGGRGEVHGYCDAGPCNDEDVDQDVTGEIYELYVDPSAQGSGGGRRLLAATVERLTDRGLTDLRLWAIAGNAAGRAFYEAQGWRTDGVQREEDLDGLAFTEVRYRR